MKTIKIKKEHKQYIKLLSERVDASRVALGIVSENCRASNKELWDVFTELYNIDTKKRKYNFDSKKMIIIDYCEIPFEDKP